MKKIVFTLLSIFVLSISNVSSQDILITELMYNNPGADDYEFLELYNNSSNNIDLAGYSITSGITHTFAATTINAGEYIVLAKDSAAFEIQFGITPLQWNSGSLNNTGELVELTDNMGVVVTDVTYGNSGDWSHWANGGGSSLVLCDLTGSNSDVANWQPAISSTGTMIGDITILASPAAPTICSVDPLVSFVGSGFTVNEDVGTVDIRIAMNYGSSSSAAEVVASFNMGASSATIVDDFTADASTTLAFAAGAVNDTLTLSIPIIDDAIEEATEIIAFTLEMNMGCQIMPNGFFSSFSVVDNDTPLTNALLISGVFDAQPGGSTGAKGLELYALSDIPDLSIFGVESANNGATPSSPEFTFPSVAATAGDCIYVAADSALFADFFGFDANYENGAMNINGDDAIVLYENNTLIDVFGEGDGTGLAWEHTDGWAYRNDAAGPSATFIEGNWQYSGINQLEDGTDNATMTVPFPTCSYSSVPPTEIEATDDYVEMPEGDIQVTLTPLGNDITPNPITSLTIITPPTNGTATVDMMNSTIQYIPNDDFCGMDEFTYEVCDANSCDQALVTIIVPCPTVYNVTDIAGITGVDTEGVAVAAGQTVEITGVVHGVDLQGANPVQFTVIDATDGIGLFSSNDYGYTVVEGDEVTVQGTVNQFNGLTQINPDTIIYNSANNTLDNAETVTVLDENTESNLVKIEDLLYVDEGQWLGDGSSFNVDVIDGLGRTFALRIDNDTELANMPAPFAGGTTFNVTGIGGQFDTSSPYDEGYQLFPRYGADFEATTSTNTPSWANGMKLYPNPATNQIIIESDIMMTRISISNILGQKIYEINNAELLEQVNLKGLDAGVYIVTFTNDNESWSTEFVKQ